MKCPDDYTVIDIETTGLKPATDFITEISALKYRCNRKVDEFVTLVKPDCHIPYHITRLTGIDDAAVADAPAIDEVIWQFKEFIGDDILMGYNVSFDISFLTHKLQDCYAQSITNNHVDVMRMAQEVLPHLGRVKQTVLAQHFGLATKGAHRADVDCEICNGCYQRLKQLQLPGYHAPLPQRELYLAEAAQALQNKHIALLGVPEGFYLKNLQQILQQLGAVIDTDIVAATNIVVVGTGGMTSCDNEQLAQVIELKNKGAELALLKDNVFVKGLLNKGWVSYQ